MTIAKTLLSIVFVVSGSDLNAQPKRLKPAPVFPVPSAQQLAWHAMEMNAFIHFTTNTFTDKEWGYGDESPAVFNPDTVDAVQWAKVLRETGFKGMILTCKHHDGFCLWPSAYTEHSVKNSPFRNGKADIVKEVSEAARKNNLAFGVYLSPWDRNRADYGRPSYLDYYRNQLKELFTQYGPIFEMWFDGANGGDGYYGGTRDKRSIDGSRYYEWPRTLEMVTGIQPNVLFFSDAGPHIRWVGNERGVAGSTNWNMINPDTLYAGKPGITKLLGTGSEDGTKWIPAEVDVSIRPGWFYHASEDSKVKTPEELFRIYLTSVGRGSNLLLNIPPDRTGRFNEMDVQSLRGFRKILDSVFARNLASEAQVSASVNRRGKWFRPQTMIDNDKHTYWSAPDGEDTATVELRWGRARSLRYLVIQEYIALGQRVKSFSVDVFTNGEWKTVAKETTVGYKRILPIGNLHSDALRIRITAARACPLISNVEVY